MDWFLTSFQWYIYLLVFGLIFFPLTKKIFSRFFEHGYPFAKTIGILLVSYILFVFGVLKFLPFSRTSLLFIITLFILFYLLVLGKKEKTTQVNIKIIIFEEILFFISFLFLSFVRGQEPSIRGLEKFMDYGFMNSIIRSEYFPPLDIWLSGFPINYYYFGHLTGAFLIKLTNIKASIGYNLILATIFAQATTLAFSLISNIVFFGQKYLSKSIKLSQVKIVFLGLLGSFVLNLGGNLHTIYLFTQGYPNDHPVPFWKILSIFNPTKYWYPNATRFIPFTIHEFPSYSYVVADLHGHVFDIPFVLLTLAILFLLFIHLSNKKHSKFGLVQLIPTIFLGFLTSVHYMTNAFDGPIYLLLTAFVFILVYGLNFTFVLHIVLLFISFWGFALPFSYHFSPFVSGIGVNCSPDFLVNMQRFGPFLFEKGNCQPSPLWMLFVLWGFFLTSFLILVFIIQAGKPKKQSIINIELLPTDLYILILFIFGIFLITIPEFFYIKDIYPAHFRANTMFKLGYQAFMMMSIGSLYTLFRLKFVTSIRSYILKVIYILLLFLVVLYPFFSFTSYYGDLQKKPQIDGEKWMETFYPEDLEIINYLNNKIIGQPVILEAQGDSYTDYERISAYTGLPTVAGWWVHEWLWRGSVDVVGQLIPEIVTIYESKDIELTRSLIEKYHIKYVVISKMEREKYKNIDENKFNKIGTKIFQSSNGFGALYQVDYQ